MATIGQSQFGDAFTFGRTEAGVLRDASGALVAGMPDHPRFDHDETGTALGLLIGPGEDTGGGDRVAIRTTALPAAFFDRMTPGAADVTILHRFVAAGRTAETLRAWYSRNAKAAIDALLAQAGHHRELGVVAGFLPARGGTVARYRDREWTLAGLLAVPGGVLDDGTGRPLIIAGAARTI